MTRSSARNEFTRYLSYLFIYFIEQKTSQKKNITMVKPFTGSFGMAMLFLATPLLQPAHDGWLRVLLKDFIELCKLPLKTISYYTHILFHFLTPSELDHPDIDSIEPPLRPLLVAHLVLAPLCHACSFLAGWCVAFVVWWPPKATIGFISINFCRFIRHPNNVKLSPT